MRARSPRSPSLASPAFIAALALLVTNDFLLKPLFHNWATGKLSDFAGLFALAIFCATFWPRRRLLIGVVITAAFVFLKSGASQPLIGWVNGFAPFPIARTVDYTDLSAVPAIWLGLWAVHGAKAWSLPRAAEAALALFALIAFTATTAPPPYVVRGTVAIAPSGGATAADGKAVQAIFDEVTAKHHLPCRVCDAIVDGRVYYDGGKRLTASFDAETQTVFFVIAGGSKRAERKEVDRLSTDLRAALGDRFPDLNVTGYVSGRGYEEPRLSGMAFAVSLEAENLDVAAAESAQRTLSQIVEDTVREYGLRLDGSSLIYYAGRRLGPTAYDRELTLMARYSSHTSLGVAVWSRSDAYEPLQRSLTETLKQRLDAAFGAERVTVTK